MSDSGYNPQRVRQLSARVVEGIDALRSTRSPDPAAADAMRVLRLTRQNLEDLWMPTIRAIERSNAMVSWVKGDLPDWPLAPTSPQAVAYRAASDDELIAHLEWADRASRMPGAVIDLDVLAHELARRIRHDSAFADRVAARAPTILLVGSLAARTEFSSSFLSAVITTMMWPHGPQATADLDGFAASLSAALAAIIDDPAACLDLIADPAIMFGLASWERPDRDVVANFVTSALHTAVVVDPSRVGDGYRALGTLTTLTNGPLDRGITAGMALGVAASMAGYVDTLGPALRQEGVHPVLVIDDVHDVEVELGSYDDVVDLFGALLRDAPAQAALGSVLGAYTRSIVDDLGADIGVRPGLEYVARFADLIGDAGRTERAELLMAAAAAEARRREAGAVIGFGVNAALMIGGVGALSRVVVGRSITMATNFVAPVAPRTLPDARVPATTYDLITVAVLGVVCGGTGERRRAGLGGVGRSAWTELSSRLTDIDAEPDLEERTRKILRLDRWIETEVPLLAGYLARVRSVAGMDELTESRNAVAAD